MIQPLEMASSGLRNKFLSDDILFNVALKMLHLEFLRFEKSIFVYCVNVCIYVWVNMSRCMNRGHR